MYHSMMITMNNNIKIIFTDLDWTLFDHHYLSYIPSALEALQKARDKGVKVIICTSRSYASLLKVDVYNKIPHDGYIASNGAIAKVEDKYIYRHFIKEDVVRKILDEFSKRGLVGQINSYDKAFLTGEETPLAKDFYDHWYEYRPLPKKYEGEEVTSILLFAKPGEEDFLHQYGLTLFRFSDIALDVNSRPHIKSEGVSKVLEYYGYNKEDAVAIGDDIADIEMFKEVKYGVAMGNAKQEVKDAAYLVTDDIKNDGYYKALLKLGIIDE